MKIVKRQFNVYGIFLIGIFIFSFFFITLLSFYQDSSGDVPFEVQGGSILFKRTIGTNHTIYAQSYSINLTFSNEFTGNIKIINFPTSNISVIGLSLFNDYTVVNSVILQLHFTKSNENSNIQIIADHQKENFSFIIIGDTQGIEDKMIQLQDTKNLKGIDFILHLGDITSFGTVDQLERYEKLQQSIPIPIYYTPGNHDVKHSNTTDEYESFFGIPNYSFSFGDYQFISLDTSSMDLTESTMNFLEQQLNNFQSRNKVIFTHVPMEDPRGLNHDITNNTQVERFYNLIENEKVKLVLSGHVHLFNKTYNERLSTWSVTSGGGGATLYETPENGGYYHYTKISINSSNSLSIIPVILSSNGEKYITLSIDGKVHSTYTYYELLSEFSLISKNSSFQNQFGNWRSYGKYTGIPIKDFIDIMGGITPEQKIEVTAKDYLTETFSYGNVYPNETFYQHQGGFLLALSYNDSLSWDDGPRTVFLAPDEKYSNDDCMKTSYPNEGWYFYPSAGFRWIRWVVDINIIT